jgi:hypothetical protein
MNLPPQLYVPRSKFEPKKFRRGQQKIDNMYVNKPSGAFWTSTWDGRTSDWKEWVEYNMPEWDSKSGAIFQAKSVKVYTISNKSDYEKLYKLYPNVDKGERQMHIDWKEASKSLDGVWCKNPSAHPALWGWDVECTAWFNTSKLKLDKVVNL